MMSYNPFQAAFERHLLACGHATDNGLVAFPPEDVMEGNARHTDVGLVGEMG